ncbi:MAG TPA: hypothetical protein VFC47_03190 [Caulobacteraceae bacterium]|nr:hypothetical protein [Caulobacteraceae bacterium]
MRKSTRATNHQQAKTAPLFPGTTLGYRAALAVHIDNVLTAKRFFLVCAWMLEVRRPTRS